MADIYPDWFFLPNAATLRFPFAVTNQTGSTVYVKTIVTGLNGGALPAGWTDTPKQHGSLAHGSTLYAYHEASRSKPTFTNGVYDEQIELRIQFYSDASYSTLVLTLVEQLNISNYDSSLVDWTLHDSDDFEIDNEGLSIPSLGITPKTLCEVFARPARNTFQFPLSGSLKSGYAAPRSMSACG
ncbi:MAG: hypothetical protein QW823_04010 [Candidatus Caldarchaeum sp.]